jgi:4-hydroxy-3-methylbut-2-en-1-yl diphosphate synthase IspG/GcpE
MESAAGHAWGIVDAVILTEGMKLERELNAANERIKLLEAANSDVARIAAERDRAHERIKRLEEAGDAMAQDHNPFTFIDWQRAKEAKP